MAQNYAATEITPSSSGRLGAAMVGGVGLLAYAACVMVIQPLQWNVVTWTVEVRSDIPWRPLSLGFAVLLLLIPPACALTAAHFRDLRGLLLVALSHCRPLLLSVPLGVAAFFQEGPLFPLSLLHMLGAGWVVYRSLSYARLRILPSAVTDGRETHFRWQHICSEPIVLFSLIVLIAIGTLIHTRLQINFFEHFMLGHADIGHFAEELKNALAGRGLRSDSFDNTRLGWHFTPLLYALVPFYWLWPSPVMLMVCSALFVQAAALPLYWLARRVNHSPLVAGIFAGAWLLHPSISRLPYSGTYGFQWVYITLPLFFLWIGAAFDRAGIEATATERSSLETGIADERGNAKKRRWGLFFFLLMVLLLCRETTAATTLGFGVYLAWTRRPRTIGLATAMISIVYAVACVVWIIPYFAQSGSYERAQVFGPLGSSFTEVFASAVTRPGLFFGRLVRRESFMFVATLVTTLALTPLRSWKLGLSAVPALLLILLLDNPQWLSIKFWYQASVLPLWFACAVLASEETNEAVRSEASSAIGRSQTASALAVLMCCAWGHYLLGFSPLSKSYDVYAASPVMQRPHPAYASVQAWRRSIPRSASILATERLAAHFTDYRRIYTGVRPERADYVIIDRNDRWDASGLPQMVDRYRADPEYHVYDEVGSMIVFERVTTPRGTPEE